MRVAGELAELPDPPVPLWRRPLTRRRLSMLELSLRMERIARDPRARGAVLDLRPGTIPPARQQALRHQVQSLRGAGKRVVFWASHYTAGGYHVACAADEVLIQPGGSLGPLGLHQQYMFLGAGLERAGIRADLIRVGPYKTAGDTLTEAAMSAEMREMVEWLASDVHTQLLEAFEQGRHLSREAVEALVEASPLTDEEALEAGAVDGILSEEALPAHLGDGRPARLREWSAARRTLRKPPPDRPGRRIAILPVQGLIVDGESARSPLPPPRGVPFLFSPRTGDLTLARQARRLAADRRVAAVVLHVDSQGGSAAASEAMTSALAALAARKPLVAAMGSVAASGGYYVTCAAREVTAWPGTVTGSIGVLGGKVVYGALLDRLSVREEEVKRGRHAGMFRSAEPFTEEERDRVRRSVERSYRVFLERVAAARRMEPAEVDAVGRGRVYTGSQAQGRRLVDGLGGLPEAIARASRLAGLGEGRAVRVVNAGGGPATPAGAAALLTYPLESFEALSGPPLLCLSSLLVEDRL
ncbi:MAG: signal peptide peptidase SppA [Candidatus Dormibacterales bacterium]